MPGRSVMLTFIAVCACHSHVISSHTHRWHVKKVGVQVRIVYSWYIFVTNCSFSHICMFIWYISETGWNFFTGIVLVH